MQEILEPIEQSKTAGEIHNELIKKEPDKCTNKDLGYASTDTIWDEVADCLNKHLDTFSVDQFCIVMQYASDPHLTTVIRRKFYAWPYLPDPRPEQSVWMYDKSDESITLLWSLPDAWAMAKLSEALFPNKGYERMKKWCDWWYEGSFWTNIRKQHNIDMLSEHEFIRINREMGAKFIDDKEFGLDPDAFYLPEVRIKKLEAKANIGLKKSPNNILRQTY